MKTELLTDTHLDSSWVVANNSMNRERGLHGNNSYAKELRFDVLGYLQARLQERERVVWVDLCCGSGKALMEAAAHFEAIGCRDHLLLLGVDLVDYFAPVPEGLTSPTLVTAPLRSWSPPAPCDLITCVHGLHYVGDKLGIIANAASWLAKDGLFLAHLDRANVRSERDTSLARQLAKLFAASGIDYHRRHHILKIEGQRVLQFPYTYLGARDDAGPNFTGQPAVHAFYRKT